MTEQNTSPTAKAVLPGILFAVLLLTLFSLFTLPLLLLLTHSDRINETVYFFSRILYLFCTLAICLFALKAEKQKLLLWEERKYKLRTYLLHILGIFAALFIGMMVIQVLLSILGVHQNSSVLSGLIQLFRANKLLLIFTAALAGFAEELVFRGYLLPRVEIILKKPYIAIFLTSLLFGLYHLKYGTLFLILGPFFNGVVFSIYYRKCRNIKILMLSHFLWDLIALFFLINSPDHIK